MSVLNLETYLKVAEGPCTMVLKLDSMSLVQASGRNPTETLLPCLQYRLSRSLPFSESIPPCYHCGTCEYGSPCWVAVESAHLLVGGVWVGGAVFVSLHLLPINPWNMNNISAQCTFTCFLAFASVLMSLLWFFMSLRKASIIDMFGSFFFLQLNFILRHFLVMSFFLCFDVSALTRRPLEQVKPLYLTVSLTIKDT